VHRIVLIKSVLLGRVAEVAIRLVMQLVIKWKEDLGRR
jgi:hypothetical protein